MTTSTFILIFGGILSVTTLLTIVYDSIEDYIKRRKRRKALADKRRLFIRNEAEIQKWY